MNRREFICRIGESACLAGLAGCVHFRNDGYSVAILGDTHYDVSPESVYHSHYDESNRWAKIQHAEFRRNGEMWRERCPSMLAASAKLAQELSTSMVLQMGDLIQGDCDHVATHRKMLDDCVRMLRTPYPKELPFLTVIGNHDFRGKGARNAYFKFVEPFLSRELGFDVKYPVFSFRKGPDLWIFCNFELGDLMPIVEHMEANPDVRHVFLVTHGPFTTAECGDWRWRLGGRLSNVASRRHLYEALSRRRAIVLSGHTHTVAYYRHENEFGGFSEFTSNSVWESPELATAEPMAIGVAEYGKFGLARERGARLDDLKKELDFFRPGLVDYFMGKGAGHFRLNVSDTVTMEFYPGRSLRPAKTFVLS